MSADFSNAKQFFTTLTKEGTLEFTIEPMSVAEPGEHEVVVQMEATPINPSDLGLLTAPADMDSLRREDDGDILKLVSDVTPQMQRVFAGRAGQKLPAGNEGAGTVVAAGSSDAAQALLGKTVSMAGGEMYATHRTMKAMEVMPLPDGAAAREGASLFVNPLTAIGMTNTMRMEGHTALVHTAAASNLGQMLAKLCLADDIPLVAIVRSAAQAKILTDIGLTHVVDSSAESFFNDLVDALVATGATIAFDAIGGGTLASTILVAMETAAGKRGEEFSVYGSTTHKQVYQYGRLDTGPTTLTGGYGLFWGVSGWLLTPHIQKIGMEKFMEMRMRVMKERNGIFASHYTKEISLADMIDVDTVKAYDAKATGTKFLVNPSL